VSLQRFLGLEPFAADCDGREDGLESDGHREWNPLVACAIRYRIDWSLFPRGLTQAPAKAR
jgi:hypothetical protein